VCLWLGVAASGGCLPAGLSGSLSMALLAGLLSSHESFWCFVPSDRVSLWLEPSSELTVSLILDLSAIQSCSEPPSLVEGKKCGH
jgi:hypothetical protein